MTGAGGSHKVKTCRRLPESRAAGAIPLTAVQVANDATLNGLLRLVLVFPSAITYGEINVQLAHRRRRNGPYDAIPSTHHYVAHMIRSSLKRLHPAEEESTRFFDDDGTSLYAIPAQSGLTWRDANALHELTQTSHGYGPESLRDSFIGCERTCQSPPPSGPPTSIRPADRSRPASWLPRLKCLYALCAPSRRRPVYP